MFPTSRSFIMPGGLSGGRRLLEVLQIDATGALPSFCCALRPATDNRSNKSRRLVSEPNFAASRASRYDPRSEQTR
jgi:hypothetical protein